MTPRHWSIDIQRLCLLKFMSTDISCTCATATKVQYTVANVCINGYGCQSLTLSKCSDILWPCLCLLGGTGKVGYHVSFVKFDSANILSRFGNVTSIITVTRSSMHQFWKAATGLPWVNQIVAVHPLSHVFQKWQLVKEDTSVTSVQGPIRPRSTSDAMLMEQIDLCDLANHSRLSKTATIIMIIIIILP